jgi:hypothetical protein
MQVKTCADIEYGVITQCLLHKNVAKASESSTNATLGNILVKLNTKLGGVNNGLAVDERCDTKYL